MNCRKERKIRNKRRAYRKIIEARKERDKREGRKVMTESYEV